MPDRALPAMLKLLVEGEYARQQWEAAVMKKILEIGGEKDLAAQDARAQKLRANVRAYGQEKAATLLAPPTDPNQDR